jgi:hypothetical protein
MSHFLKLKLCHDVQLFYGLVILIRCRTLEFMPYEYCLTTTVIYHTTFIILERSYYHMYHLL